VIRVTCSWTAKRKGVSIELLSDEAVAIFLMCFNRQLTSNNTRGIDTATY
jgi:hypothetical protein